MITVWRMLKTKYIHDAFSGEGARRYGGRWNSPGSAIVYTSESVSLAILEIVVHLGRPSSPPNYSVIKVTFEDSLVEEIDPILLPPSWAETSNPTICQGLGDLWIKARRSVALKVPSAVVKTEYNYLLNPAHPDFSNITMGTAEAIILDGRLY